MPKRALPIAVLAVALLLALIGVVRLISSNPSATGSPASGVVELPADPATTAETGEETVTVEPMRRLQVLVYYPMGRRNGLHGEPHEIFETALPGDRAKQILADLISGPRHDSNVRAVPQGTQLRQVYILDDKRIAYLDFSSHLRDGLTGGSNEELLTVYSIVNSVALNVPEIRRVAILIDGQPIESLSGHVDLRRPIPPRRSWIAAEGSPNS